LHHLLFSFFTILHSICNIVCHVFSKLRLALYKNFGTFQRQNWPNVCWFSFKNFQQFLMASQHFSEIIPKYGISNQICIKTTNQSIILNTSFRRRPYFRENTVYRSERELHSVLHLSFSVKNVFAYESWKINFLGNLKCVLFLFLYFKLNIL